MSQLSRLEKLHAADHRGFIESRRSLVSQRDRYKAQVEAVKAIVRTRRELDDDTSFLLDVLEAVFIAGTER